ncbi:MAG: metallophosphoesterase family protein [Candidatus Kapaibacterium sp.]
MTIGIISDIHGNLPALEAVLADIDQRGIDMLFCLGDLVGYAPWPNEVVATVRRRGIPTIAGNYDEGVGLHSDDCGCAYKTDEDKARGSESIAYTNAVVTDDTRNYLRQLPRQMRLEFGTGHQKTGLLMVHGSPRKINEYLFEDRPDQSFHRIMADAQADIMLFGHTHKPFHKVLSHELEGRTAYRHAINTGSVGKPKDGDPRACYMMLRIGDHPDAVLPHNIDVEFIRVAYDVEQAARAVEESPLPDAFAQMLREAY